MHPEGPPVMFSTQPLYNFPMYNYWGAGVGGKSKMDPRAYLKFQFFPKAYPEISVTCKNNSDKLTLSITGQYKGKPQNSIGQPSVHSYSPT